MDLMMTLLSDVANSNAGGAIGAGRQSEPVAKARSVKVLLKPSPASRKRWNDIRANMILTAALVEGAALFAIIVGLLAVL